jgi:putative flippase GtrA
MIFDRILLKFILVGGINTLVGSVIMFLLYNFTGLGYWVSSGASYIAGSVLSFFLNKYVTFGVKKWSGFMIAAFIATIAISYVFAYGVSKPAMNYLLRDVSRQIRDNAALLTGMCLFTGINYLGQRLIVFRSNHK